MGLGVRLGLGLGLGDRVGVRGRAEGRLLLGRELAHLARVRSWGRARVGVTCLCEHMCMRKRMCMSSARAPCQACHRPTHGPTDGRTD